MKVKKIPVRKCVGCGEGKPKKELIRIVKNKENEIFVDTNGKANGRGVYICSSLDCLEKAQKAKKINRALKTDIPNDIYDEITKVIKNHG